MHLVCTLLSITFKAVLCLERFLGYLSLVSLVSRRITSSTAVVSVALSLSTSPRRAKVALSAFSMPPRLRADTFFRKALTLHGRSSPGP